MTFPLTSLLWSMLPALITMSFYTLLERKILGYAQLRKGPNKVSITGILQPIADALKLFTKELNMPTKANILPFKLSPVINLILAMALWLIIPSPSPFLSMSFSLLFMMCLSSLNVYTTLIAGWSSNSKYSLLGAMRGVAQAISYEVTMALILIWALLFMETYNMQKIYQETNFNTSLLAPFMFLMWFVIILAETNRTPFDFAEGESELVSGFNTEYSGGSFALLFMAEYLNMILLSLITMTIFFMNSEVMIFNQMTMIPKSLIMMFMFIMIRAAYPRMRYDQLMSLTWTRYLPLSLLMILMILNIL
uniref:NADH-ubiquinone oxidoreductase chain 1 n=1 Tax=Trypanobia cryptica TaxID=2814713 RepID=A0A0K0YD69_9ANNE|nr:NADH dehydrogenase subunit 1 [Trypanobia cryptica]